MGERGPGGGDDVDFSGVSGNLGIALASFGRPEAVSRRRRAAPGAAGYYGSVRNPL